MGFRYEKQRLENQPVTKVTQPRPSLLLFPGLSPTQPCPQSPAHCRKQCAPDYYINEYGKCTACVTCLPGENPVSLPKTCLRGESERQEVLGTDLLVLQFTSLDLKVDMSSHLLHPYFSEGRSVLPGGRRHHCNDDFHEGPFS